MATQTDYYVLLGVPRSASDEQIRSAYRKLARQYHPDVNSASDASERFKAITEAYEVLTDPQRRQRYDMFGSTTGGLGDFGIGDLFETFFGGDLRRREPRGPMRGADLRREIEIDLIDAVQGRERVITVPRLETCERCHGKGAEPGTSTSTCATCNGRGEVRQVQQSVFGRFVNVSTCPRCGGAGKTVDKQCTRCRGEGRERKDREIGLSIPAGIDDGQQLRVAGEGEAGMRGGPTGDLYVLIRLKEHQLFRREGDDLVHLARVSPAQAALGDEITVPTIEGPDANLRVPGGADHTVKAYLVEDVDAVAKVADARDALGHLQAFGLGPIGELAVREVEDEDWLEAWKATVTPIRVGRFLVRPTWSDVTAPDAITIALDPGMAFGTGLHPTTQQCLEAVSYLDLEGLRVLDVGTGSGILAIAAAKRGAREVVGVDTDPLAVRAANENAVANGVSVEGRLGSAADVDGKFDVVLANLVGSVLVQIAPNLRARLRTSGSLVAAGITTQAERDVLSAFVAEGLGVVDGDDRADCGRVVLTG